MSPRDFDPIAYIQTPRWRSMNLGLSRIKELLSRLGNPHQAFRSVHVAGTNGKGSTCAFLASILQQAGYKTGLFTSPYIVEFSERIRVNGGSISPAALRQVTLGVRDVAESMAEHPTEFELMTAVAFCYFAECGCEIAVIEVGLGGRLDSTNVLEARNVAACAIAPIARDHCEMLGNSLEKIAREKAGIMKPGVPVVSAPQAPEVVRELQVCAHEVGAPLSFVNPDALQGENSDFSYGEWTHLAIPFAASYQRFNAALALEVVLHLQETAWNIPPDALRAGLAQTHWPGRFELMQEAPAVVFDGAHNPHGMRTLANELRARFGDARFIFVLGVMADKDYAEMLKYLVGLHAEFICVEPPNPRALPALDLAQAIREAHAALGPVLMRDPTCASSVAAGVHMALAHARKEDVVVVAGSLYQLAEAKAALDCS